MTNRKFLVITGMHRSHTSLLCNMIAAAGMPLHDQLVNADPTNPYGHFEDRGILDFHKAVLADNGARWHRGVDRELILDRTRAEEGRALVAQRFEALGPNWAFKTPHSSLFLDYWAGFPEARFVFIYREPQPVLSSLMRRTGRQLYYKPYAPFMFARAYAVYNEHIARCAAAHPQRSYTLSSRHLLASPQTILGDMATKFDIELPGLGALAGLVDENIVSARSNSIASVASRVLAKVPRVAGAYKDVDRLCDSARLG